LEEKENEKQLPSWNRRGGPKGRGGSEVKMVVFESTTPSLLLLLLIHPFIHNFCDRAALSDGRILAMGYDFTSETSMAFHGKSDLLHHDLHV